MGSSMLTEIPQLTLGDHAKAGVPISVPWMRRPVDLGQGLESTRFNTDNPWISIPAFDFGGRDAKWISYNSKASCTATFRDSESTSHGSTADHGSGSLGLTVGSPFLKSNVTGTYDKTVIGTSDSHKVSRTNFYGAGSVQFTNEPPLSSHAKSLLKSFEGSAAFRAVYGDYYVAALKIGGDSGAFMSVSEDETTTTTTTSVEVSVKVLFFGTKSHNESKVDVSYVKHLSFTFCGYDTLDGVNQLHRPEDRESLGQVQSSCSQYLQRADELSSRIMSALKRLGVEDGKTLSLAECSMLCQAGLVVQILCMPYETLREYQVALA